MNHSIFRALALTFLLSGCVESPYNTTKLAKRSDPIPVAIWLPSPDGTITAQEPSRFRSNGLPVSWVDHQDFCIGAGAPCFDFFYEPTSEWTDPVGITWWRYEGEIRVDDHHWRDAVGAENAKYATYLRFKYRFPDGTQGTATTFNEWELIRDECFADNINQGGLAVMQNCAASPGGSSWYMNPGSPSLYLTTNK